MLIHPGFWSSSKGMVLVPNLSGLSTTDATNAIIAAGLLNSGNSTTNTGDSGLNGKVASQDPASGTKVQYESNVSYVSYNYVAPTPVYVAPTPVPVAPTPVAPTPVAPQNRSCTQAQIEFGITCPSSCYSGGWGALC
jgi:beta-lactam-binding protein with PASTA domain